MHFKNECDHPIENYLFSMVIDSELCDVWVVEPACKSSFVNNPELHQFCLRFGNEGHEYRSSWDCTLIERILSRRKKYAENDTEVEHIDQLIKLRDKLKEIGYWDIDWSFDPEIEELI